MFGSGVLQAHVPKRYSLGLCRAAQSEAEKLRSQVEKLQRENQLLRARLGEDSAEQEVATPRKHIALMNFVMFVIYVQM